MSESFTTKDDLTIILSDFSNAYLESAFQSRFRFSREREKKSRFLSSFGSKKKKKIFLVSSHGREKSVQALGTSFELFNKAFLMLLTLPSDKLGRLSITDATTRV